MSPRLTPGYEPWRPLFVAALPELEEELRRDLGPVRARSLALALVEEDGAPVLRVEIDSGDPDYATTEQAVHAWLDVIIEPVPDMRLVIEFVAHRRLRVVE